MRPECLGCVREGEIPEVVVLQEEHRAESWGGGHLGILQASCSAVVVVSDDLVPPAETQGGRQSSGRHQQETSVIPSSAQEIEFVVEVSFRMDWG